MKRKIIVSAALLCGMLLGTAPSVYAVADTRQTTTNAVSVITGKVVDENGDPAIGASVIVKGRKAEGVSTDADGKFSLRVAPGTQLAVSYVGYQTIDVPAQAGMIVQLVPASALLDEVVVTALGVKKDKKSLGYAIDDIDSEELMRNKTANPISSLSGKIAGVNVTQSSGAAGAGAQIILRGGTSGSETRDNQPLFVVDGIIYDNSSGVGGKSNFDGSTRQSTTSSNRLMDINPEDIEHMSVLKGPAASALYGSRAANGVIIITTKKGKNGNVEVNLSAKYTTSWVKDLPKMQSLYKRGRMRDTYDDNQKFIGSVYETDSYNSWGERFSATDRVYDSQLEDFFQQGGIWDTNVSISGGNENGNFYLSGSYFDQDGVVPTTGYTKTTFRFNGEQKWKLFTFGANAAYSEARTDKTLTGAGLYGSNMNGALQRIYTFGAMDDMTHYLNEDGSRYRMRTDLEPWEEQDNPYWIINRNKLNDKTVRFTGSFNVRADLTDWWWINFRAGVDNYTTDNNKRIAAGGVTKDLWQDGMLSENTTRYQYLSTNFMTNFSKTFGDFGFNLLLGTSTDNTNVKETGLMAYRFKVPDFFSFTMLLMQTRHSGLIVLP
ncbi:MAG: SusC/RagA family TonB-linked outer membrane protein, partial [Muribaculaceae bacterium]|nr:SusC/RagA family TonB-linked outer membrane protein [Muribaculaceae bacterium]